MTRPSVVLALLAILFLVFAPPLWAGDSEKEDSAAGKLFRDAWWAETGSGALDKAVEGYRAAVEAKGSAAIRARSLYRMAVVLQRMGKTEDGVRALERLAKEFPAQTEWLAKAKERLEEWTAEDLRVSFADWYKRYQYSPAFQAKIVDLILTLGSRDEQAGQGAEQELLTIGEPALAALGEHTRSPNRFLRNQCIELMVKIGKLPPAAVLWEAEGWERQPAFWKLLGASEGSVRAAYLETAAASDDYRAAWVTAALSGSDAVLDIVAKEASDTKAVTGALLAPLMTTKQSAAFWTRLRAIAMNADTHLAIRAWIARIVIHMWYDTRRHGTTEPTGLTVAEILRWFETQELRSSVLPLMRNGAVPSPDAWQAPARAALELESNARGQKELIAAMCGQLRLVPAGADVQLAVRAFVHVLSRQSFNQLDAWPLGESPDMAGSGERPRAVLAQAIAQTEGPHIRSAPRYVWQHLRGRKGVFESLLDWIGNAKDAGVRAESMQIAAHEIRDRVARITQSLDDPARRRELHDALFQPLRDNPMLVKLDWDVESLTRLVETAMAAYRYDEKLTIGVRVGGSKSMMVTSPFSTFAAQTLARLLQHERTRDLLIDAAFAAPERFSPRFFELFGKAWARVDAHRGMVLSHLRARWKAWTPEQRGPGLRLFVTRFLLGEPSEEVTRFLRSVLEEGAVDDTTRLHLVERLDKLTLADLRMHYDFSDPKQVDEATAFLSRLEQTEAVYDAFLPALRADGPEAHRMFTAFGEGPESRIHHLVRRLLQHNEPSTNAFAHQLLQTRDSVVDLPLWIEMLSHRRSGLRSEAAKALGRLYNDAAIKALAKAVDDPDPTVRDAVLAALERIEKTEKQKARWRKFAAER